MQLSLSITHKGFLYASLGPSLTLRREIGTPLSLQGLCFTWDMRFAHLGALLCLQGLGGTIERLSELISRPR